MIKYLIYILIWILVFLFPVLEQYAISNSFALEFNWQMIFFRWINILPFLAFFLLNEFVLLKHFFYKKKFFIYSAIVLFYFLLFIFAEPIFLPKADFFLPKADFKPNLEFEKNINHQLPPMDLNKFPKREFEVHESFFNPRKLQKSSLFVLLIALNFSISIVYKNYQDKKKFDELEKNQLKNQLDYLKYQLSPHFFMNTLNNIHALIDIDALMAQDTIVELGKLMRYLLYESNKAKVLLSQEVDFINNYISLMKIRFSDKLKITFESNLTDSNTLIAPLVYICLVENAFKHGVSNRMDSFIDIKICQIENQINFTICNSKFNSDNKLDEHHGIGLENLKKRLDLIYQQNYKLQIVDNKDNYLANLIIFV